MTNVGIAWSFGHSSFIRHSDLAIRHSEGVIVVSRTESKEVLRARMRAARRALPPADIAAFSVEITRRVVALAEFSGARTVGCYLARPREVQTKDLLERSWRDGRRVCVPAFDTAQRRYVLAWLDQDEPTMEGPAHIPQPERIRVAAPRDVELIIVPAVAFDRAGRRLGHGGGHYDRLLAQCAGLKVGVAFEVQMVEKVPSGQYDVAVDIVITERQVYPPR
jgi:5-formyltetrahydrofolate cyclo-ligase